MFETLEDAEKYLLNFTAAQSFVLAAVLRSMLVSRALKESDLREALDATEAAAFQRRTPETGAVAGLVQLLRRDLGWPEGT